MSLRFRVIYHSTSDLLADIAQQVSRRGLLIRVPMSAADRGAPVILEIATPVGKALVQASVLQVLPGLGVAVELDPAAFAPLAEAARANPVAGGATQHERIERAASAPVVDEPPEPPEEPAAARDPHQRAREASRDATAQARQNAQQIQIALHGDKNQRMAILRDQNRQLHGYVLRNPGVQLDEIVFISKQATVSPDLLAQIAARREWAERPEVAIAIVRNPKTPVPLAIRMLDHVSDSELRNLAKMPSVRDPIQRAARKKLLG